MKIWIIILVLFISIFSVSASSTNCSKNIDKSVVGFNLDWSFPWWNWSGFISDSQCQDIDRWIWKYDYVNGNYVWKGIKLYILITCFVTAIVIGIYLNNYRLNKMLKETNELLR